MKSHFVAVSVRIALDLGKTSKFTILTIMRCVLVHLQLKRLHFYWARLTIRKPLPLKEKKLRCETCGARFAREYTLEKHLVVHSVKLDDVHQIHCGLRFLITSTGPNHIPCSPQTEKPFECEFCPTRFPCKTRLQMHHLNWHTVGIFSYSSLLLNPCQFSELNSLIRNLRSIFRRRSSSVRPAERRSE